jgi:hypothetical protein
MKCTNKFWHVRNKRRMCKLYLTKKSQHKASNSGKKSEQVRAVWLPTIFLANPTPLHLAIWNSKKTRNLYYPWIKPGKLLPHPTLQCIPPLQIDLHGRWRGTWSLVPRHTIIPGSNHRGNSSLIFWLFSHHPIFTVLATFSSTPRQTMIKTRSLAAPRSETRPPRKILRCRNYNRW